jgi:hypothetical protein
LSAGSIGVGVALNVSAAAICLSPAGIANPRWSGEAAPQFAGGGALTFRTRCSGTDRASFQLLVFLTSGKHEIWV